jgi:hypothetical protein
MYVRMYSCMCAHTMYVRTYVFVYVYLCMYVWMYLSMYVRTFVFLYVCTCVCIYVEQICILDSTSANPSVLGWFIVYEDAFSCRLGQDLAACKTSNAKTYVFMYIMYVCLYTYIHTWNSMIKCFRRLSRFRPENFKRKLLYACKHVCVYVCMYVCVCVYVCLHAHMYVCIHVCM